MEGSDSSVTETFSASDCCPNFVRVKAKRSWAPLLISALDQFQAIPVVDYKSYNLSAAGLRYGGGCADDRLPMARLYSVRR
jgi:hypothetical protein